MARKISGVTLMVAGILFTSVEQAWNLMHKGILTPGPTKLLFGLLGFLMIQGVLTYSGGDVSMLRRPMLKESSPALTQMCCTYELFVATNQLWDT